MFLFPSAVSSVLLQECFCRCKNKRNNPLLKKWNQLALPAKLISLSLLTPLPIPISLKHQLFLIIKYTSIFHPCFLFTAEFLLEKLKATSLSGLLISNVLTHNYYKWMSFNKEGHIWTGTVLEILRQIIIFFFYKLCDFVDMASVRKL